MTASRVHLPDATATGATGRSTGTLFPCLSGMNAQAFNDGGGQDVVALIGNQFLWYAPGYNSDFTEFGMVYGVGSVDGDLNVDLGPTLFVNAPGQLLDVAPGGRFLFGYTGYNEFAEFVGPATVGLVAWNGVELEVTAEIELAVDPTFMAAWEASVVYWSSFGNDGGYLKTTKTATTWILPSGMQGSGNPVPSLIPATGWDGGGAIVPVVTLTGACFCGDSILIAVVNAGGVGAVSTFGFSVQKGLLYQADASLSLGPGVDITTPLIGTTTFPLTQQYYWGEKIVGSVVGAYPTTSAPLQCVVGLSSTAEPGVFPVITAGVDSALLVCSPVVIEDLIHESPNYESIFQPPTLSLMRCGWANALLQFVTVNATPALVGFYGTSDDAGNPNLVPGLFHEETFTGTAIFEGGSFSMAAVQHHYWNPASPDQVFGLIGSYHAPAWMVLRADVFPPEVVMLTPGTTASDSPFFPDVPFGYPLPCSALLSGTAGTYTLTGLDPAPPGIVANDFTSFYDFATPDTPDTFGDQLNSDSSIATPGIDGVDGSFAVLGTPLFTRGTVTYDGAVADDLNFDWDFQWDWAAFVKNGGHLVVFDDLPFLETGYYIWYPTPAFLAEGSVPPFYVEPVVPPQCHSATLADGTVVFACLGNVSFLYAGGTSVFSDVGVEPRSVSATSALGTRVRLPGHRVHLPDATAPSAGRSQSPPGT